MNYESKKCEIVREIFSEPPPGGSLFRMLTSAFEREAEIVIAVLSNSLSIFGCVLSKKTFHLGVGEKKICKRENFLFEKNNP